MLAPQSPSPLNMNAQLLVIYGGQMLSRMVFYALALFQLPGLVTPNVQSMPDQVLWGASAGTVILTLLSEWMHVKVRQLNPVGQAQVRKTLYVATWALSEIPAVAGLVLVVLYGMSELSHGLFISSLLLGAWQFPRKA